MISCFRRFVRFLWPTQFAPTMYRCSACGKTDTEPSNLCHPVKDLK